MYIILLIIIGFKILNYTNPYFRYVITVDATSSTLHLIEAMINARRWAPSPLAIPNSHLQDSRVRAIIDRLRTGRFTRARTSIAVSSVRLSTSPSGSRIFAARRIENQHRGGRRTARCGEGEKKSRGSRGRRQDASKKREKRTIREEEEEEEGRHVTSHCCLFKQR